MSCVSARAVPGYHVPATAAGRIDISCSRTGPLLATRNSLVIASRVMSHSFTRDDLGRIARLARLELDSSEQELFAAQVAGILAYAEQIQRVDTTDVEPTSHAASAEGSMRPDMVRPSLPRESALAAAPEADTAAGLFKVPRVIG